MQVVSQTNAHLIGLWLQLIATGAYLVYLPQCVAILRHKAREGLSLFLPTFCALIFIITMTDVVVEMKRAYSAFGVHGGQRPDPDEFFANPATQESLLKNGLTTAIAILSDIIMVYRTLNVYSYHILVILVPGGLLVADIALGIWTVVTLSQTNKGAALVLEEVSVRVREFFIVAFCLNVLCAGLICWRIVRANAEMPRLSGRVMNRVLEAVIQTAALYCAHLLILIVSSAIGSNIFFVFLDPLPPAAALVFSMLIVRTRASTRASTDQTSTVMLSTNFRFWNTGTPPLESMVTDVEYGTTHTDLGSEVTRQDIGGYDMELWRHKSPGEGG
ncbi:hypothetical protein C8Q80DRAFT_1204766 [Daedaleopsis nitida]|nr:hypothetical protein C8Q80DRAFT_1204766 [Daedaleopsis nitida]